MTIAMLMVLVAQFEIDSSGSNKAATKFKIHKQLHES